MNLPIRAILLSALLPLTTSSWATHLLGGNVGYVYQGETAPGSGLYAYQVYMEFYLNCGDDSNWQTLGELVAAGGGSLPLGVYTQDPQNPNADKDLFTTVDMFLVDSLNIIPDLPNGCTVGAGLCAKKGLFVGQVILPLSFAGYHLYFHNFSRNITIDNLFDPNQTGIGYYAFIPPTLVNNSSPVWIGIPTPFLCITDTTTFINSASDPDGDQLIFSFETPYNSVTNQGGIQPPPGQLPWPIPEVTWNPGFSTAQPFGTGGYSFINGATGLTSYLPPLQGNYVVAVEVKEFRNGQLIGITRRDLQLQAIPCPPNATPEVSGQLPLSYTVDAGAQLCFSMDFTDVNVDSLVINSGGIIFDTAFTDPPAVLTVQNTPAGSASADFCWNTACDQGQDQPYLFSVSVIDNGCPPKSLDIVFQVTVVPFIGPQTITGPTQVCTLQGGTVYSTADITGADFNWTVNGGAIVTGQGSNSITVDWGAPGPGSVLVSATNPLGCESTPVNVSVNISPLPASDAGSDVTICTGIGTTLGGEPTGPGGSSFSWSPAGTLSDATAANPTATPTGTTVFIVQVSNTGCVNTDTVIVTVSAPAVDAGPNGSACDGDTAQLNATGIGNFDWTPANGLSATDIPDPQAFPTATTTYFVTLTDSVGCTVTDSVVVTVNTFNQNISIDPSETSGCQGDTATFSAIPDASGNNYAWSTSGGISPQGTSGNSIIIQWTTPGPGTLSVQVTDANGCAQTFDAPFESLAIPDVDAGSDTTICAGQSVQLNGSGNGTPVWSPIAGLSDPTIFDPIANPEATQTYTLTITGGNLCTNTDQTTVVVNVLPNANAGPDLSVCLGDSVQLQASGPGTYSWSPAATLSDANATNPFAFPSVTTTYTLVLTDSVTCSDNDQVTVTVSTPPNAGTNGGTTVCSTGLPFSLFNLLGGSPAPTGTWTDPDGLASDGNYVPGTGTPGGYTYTVTGSAPCPPATAVVTVNEITSPNAGQDAFLPLCSNSGPVDLFTSLGGSPDAGGTWTDENGQPFSGTFDPATTTGTVFTYFLTATAPCADDQANVTVFVTAAPDPGADDTATLCASGASFVMTDSLGGAPQAGGSWFDPSSATHSENFDPAVDAAGTWSYVLTGTGGCSDTTATLQIVLTVPDTQITGDNEICTGDTTQLVNNGNVSWSWTPNTGISDPTIGDPLFFPTTTTTYSLTVTDAGGCTAAGSIELTVNALPTANAGSDVAICAGASTTIGGTPTGPTGSSFTWTPSAGLDDDNASNPTAQPASTITYNVLVTDVNQCSASDSLVVTVNPLPLLDAGQDTSFCQGGSVQLNATGTGQFSWSPGAGLSATDIADPVASPASATTYTVTLTDGDLCVSTDQVTVAVLGLPTADAGPDLYLCPGFDVQLQGNGSGTASWSPADSLDNANIPGPMAFPDVPTTYTLTITDGNGCSASDAMLLDVNDDPPADAGLDQSICQGQQVTLGGSPTAIPGTTVLWSPSAELDDATALNPVSTPTATTLYTVTVTSDTCTSHDVVLVTLQGVAEAGFTVRLEPTCEELRAFFTDQSSGADQWLWEFSDGSTSTEQYPQHFFPYGQNIIATLTVTDGFGCTGSVTDTLLTSDFSEMVDYEIPNVFTPNGDGFNDVFTLNSNAVLGSCVSMQVFNRWGQKVFDSVGNNIVWGGRNFAGEQCITGTYFYTITVKDMAFSGTVYLNR